MSQRPILESQERERAAAAARLRFDKATAELAGERRFGGPDVPCTEIETMDLARELVAEARTRR